MITTILRPVILLILLAAAPAHGDDMETILDRMRDAAAVDAYQRSDAQWLLSGRGDENGVASGYTLRFDCTGRFVRTIDGRLGTTEGFDGTRGWRIDFSGVGGPLDLGDLARAQLEAWVTTGLWLAVPGLVDVIAVDAPGDTSDIRLTVRVADSALEATLIVDDGSALPLRLETNGASGRVVRTFRDHQLMSGLRIPARATRTVEGLAESTTTLDTLVAFPPAKGSVDAYRQPASEAGDVRFTAPAGEVALKRAPTGHLLVAPAVDGVSPGAFIFDTGAGQSGVQMNPPWAELNEVGSGLVVSMFGIQRTPILQAKRLELGPLVLTDPVFMTMDFAPFQPYFGETIAGIIGYDVLRRSVVEIDLAASRMRIHDPRSFVLQDGKWLALRFQDNHPIVAGRVEGRPGLFRIDLGASGGAHGNVVFHSPAVRDLGLLDGRATESAQLGAMNVEIGTISSFELDGERFGPVPVVFGVDESGIFADRFTTGSIGADLLQEFTIVFDYGNARVALARKQ